jgi:hypothetical protein
MSSAFRRSTSESWLTGGAGSKRSLCGGVQYVVICASFAGDRIPLRRGEDRIQEGSKHPELSDRDAWRFDDLGARRLRVGHPLGNKKRLISLSPQGQMPSAAMNLIGDDEGGLPKKRMKRIGDDNLPAQIPGIMASRRTKGASAPQPSIR